VTRSSPLPRRERLRVAVELSEPLREPRCRADLELRRDRVRGHLTVHDDSEWLQRQVRLVTDQFELADRRVARRGRVGEYVERQVKAIVGIEIAVEAIQGKAKLSQNRPDVDHDAVREIGRGKSRERNVAARMTMTSESTLTNPTVRTNDWDDLRVIRLEALSDTPTPTDPPTRIAALVRRAVEERGLRPDCTTWPMGRSRGRHGVGASMTPTPERGGFTPVRDAERTRNGHGRTPVRSIGEWQGTWGRRGVLARGFVGLRGRLHEKWAFDRTERVSKWSAIIH